MVRIEGTAAGKVRENRELGARGARDFFIVCSGEERAAALNPYVRRLAARRCTVGSCMSVCACVAVYTA